MLEQLRDLDRILRGEATRPGRLKDVGSVHVRAIGMVPLLLILGGAYGLFMGSYALINRSDPEPMQLVATTLKVPALFFLTLLVTFPSLYVFNALVGSRLTPISLMRLLVASLAVTLAVLASFGPIVGFFSLTTESYAFMKLFNVVVFATSGLLGLVFLARTLSRLSLSEPATPPGPVPLVPSIVTAAGAAAVEAAPAATSAPALEFRVDAEVGPLAGDGPLLGPHVKAVFRVWMLVFGLVGAQMAWVLRPFLGNPDTPFTWFRAREASFFHGVWEAIRSLFS